MRKKEYHVGPAGWNRKIRRLLSVREFNLPGKFHDKLYGNKKVGKVKADILFRRMCVRNALNHPSFLKRCWLYVLANGYFVMLILFGFMAYYKKSEVKNV